MFFLRSASFANSGSVRHLGLVVFMAILGLQCVGRPSAPKVQPGPRTVARGWNLPDESLRTQRLFRVRYEGPEGRGGMKLVLKLTAETNFQMLTSDALGRPLWSLQTSDSETLLIDHRGKEFCVSEEIRLPEAVFQVMPWRSLPRVLLGYLPIELEVEEWSSGGEIEFRGNDGRRWTARLEEGRPMSWILWEGDRPLLWWSRQGQGGVLSHRQGVQYRWREIVSEPLPSPLGDLQIPTGYRALDCHASNLP